MKDSFEQFLESLDSGPRPPPTTPTNSPTKVSVKQLDGFNQQQQRRPYIQSRQQFDNLRHSLSHHLQNRPGPFLLVRNNIMKVDSTFNKLIASDPCIDMIYERMDRLKKCPARVKVHEFNEEGKFENTDVVDPVNYSEIIEQQRIITEYECKLARCNPSQTAANVSNRVSQIIHKFSTILEENLKALTVKDLKQELTKYRLAISGNKLSLVNRMVAHFENSSIQQLKHCLERDASVSSFTSYTPSQVPMDYMDMSFDSNDVRMHAFDDNKLEDDLTSLGNNDCCQLPMMEIETEEQQQQPEQPAPTIATIPEQRPPSPRSEEEFLSELFKDDWKQKPSQNTPAVSYHPQTPKWNQQPVVNNAEPDVMSVADLVSCFENRPAN